MCVFLFLRSEAATPSAMPDAPPSRTAILVSVRGCGAALVQEIELPLAAEGDSESGVLNDLAGKGDRFGLSRPLQIEIEGPDVAENRDAGLLMPRHVDLRADGRAVRRVGTSIEVCGVAALNLAVLK